MVGLGGLEPPTSPLSGARSSHLSYRPETRGKDCFYFTVDPRECAIQLTWLFLDLLFETGMAILTKVVVARRAT